MRWEAQLSSEVAAQPVAAHGLVIAGSSDGQVYALDVNSGAVRWVQESSVPPLSLRGASRPLIGDGQVFVGQATGRLIAITTDTGEVAWETAIGIAEGRSEFERLVDIDADPVFADGTIYAASYQARLAALSMASGRILWSRDLSTHLPLLLAGNVIYVSTAQSEVMAVDRANGTVLWRQGELAGRAITAPLLFNGMIAVGDNEGYLHFMSPEDGRFVGRVRVSESPILDAPQVAGDLLYVVDAGGALQALRMAASQP
jgi:outer membrane protein assembly factor BamB